MKYTMEIDYDTKEVALACDGQVIFRAEGLVRGKRTIPQGIFEATVAMNGRHPPFAKGDTVRLKNVAEESLHKVLEVRQKSVSKNPSGIGDAFDTDRWEVKISHSKTRKGGWTIPLTLEKVS